MQNGLAAMKNSWWFLEKLNIELPYDVALPLLGINKKRTENLYLNEYMYMHVCSNTFTIAKRWKQTK